MNPPAKRQRQQGAGLFVLLLLGQLGVAAYLQSTNASRFSNPRTTEADLQVTLSTARDILIARAANDDNRPGSLPCPDLLTDSPGLANIPGDGKADMLTRNQCPSTIGRLPWVTLDMPEPRDDWNNTLWYVIAPNLRDDNSAIPINSDTPTGLAQDGNGEIAALLIAGRAPKAGQHRPSDTPTDYLEGELFGTGKFDYMSPDKNGNDRMLVISREELMAAVEQRAVNSVRRCLSAHARQTGHYPWPAPFSAVARQGITGARFGRLPLSQPGEGATRMLDVTASALATGQEALASAADAATQLSALEQLAEASVRTGNLLNSLAQVGEALKILADEAKLLLTVLENVISSAAANDRIARSEGSSIRAGLAAAIIAVDRLDEALLHYGLDALSWQAATQGKPPPEETTRAALRATTERLRQAGEYFTSRDTAEPRPLQQSLAGPAREISQWAQQAATLAGLISTHAEAVARTARKQQDVATASLLAISAKGGARDAINIMQDKPTTANLSKALAALVTAEQASVQLSAGLREQSKVTHGGEAAAWPMVWASIHCRFLHEEGSWWNANQWADSVFYQTSSPAEPTQATLQAAGRKQLSLIVIAGGSRRDKQARPGASIGDYLEGRNADPSRNGDALNPVPWFDIPLSRTQGNDRIAF